MRLIHDFRSSIARVLAAVLVVATAIALPADVARAATTIYVSAGASAGGGGTSWTDAFIDLEDAIAVAVDGDEIWVAAGTYTPGPTRGDFFVVEAAIDLYGGFDGTETLLSERDPSTNLTTLSGDIGIPHDITDNTYHVVQIGPTSGFTGEVLISGFTVSDGYADGSPSDVFGGGIEVLRGDVTLDQLVLTDNYADADGSAAVFRSAYSGVTLTDVTATGNLGDHNIPYDPAGSALNDIESVIAIRSSVYDPTLVFDRVSITGNEVLGLDIEAATTIIRNSDISSNLGPESSPGFLTPFAGGGVSVNRADVTIANTTIVGNGDRQGAGLRVSASSDDATVTAHNVLIADNSAGANSGGGVYINGSNDNVASLIGHNVTLAHNFSAFATGHDLQFGTNTHSVSGDPLSTAEFTNSIFWNTRTSGTIFPSTTPPVSWEQSLVHDSGGSASWSTDFGTDDGSNIDGDPAFLGYTLGDYRLRIESIAVDAGDATLLPADVADVDGDGNVAEDLPDDILGDDRVLGLDVNLGAYEAPTCSSGVSRLYVDHTAIGFNTGSSWANALTDLQDALQGAPYCDTFPAIEVWVAAGTYTPTEGTDRSVSFDFPLGGLEIYGGFNGTETSLADRNPEANPTILSGEIGAASNSDNSYHVVRFDSLGKFAGRLDGFTVTGGNADGPSDNSGGGVLVDASWPTLANLVVEDNSSNKPGAGISVELDAKPGIFNSIVRNNTAGTTGGGIYVDIPSTPTIVNVLVHDNAAGTDGGGVYNAGAAVIRSSTIADNTASGSYGGLGNVSAGAGGAMYNSVVWGNSPAASGSSSSTMSITDSNIELSRASGPQWIGPGSDGGGNIDVDPLFVDAANDDYALAVGSPSINSGSNTGVQVDTIDVDTDGDTSENVPDLRGNDRILDRIVDMGAYEYSPTDSDGDGVNDGNDNCPGTPNADQANNDGDDDGDLCDDDDDNDSVDDVDDNCQFDANADQTDTNDDDEGDACDPDDDGDGVLDGDDNCPVDANPGQENNEGDLLGDVCDDDDDNDSVDDGDDNCPVTANIDQRNNDGDQFGDRCDPDDDNDLVDDGDDNCQFAANPDQADNDDDGEGDACEDDVDGDGVLDADDNCPATSNPDQTNTDGTADGGDACDSDDDNDTRADGNDNCPLDANTDQVDADGDGIGDVCDPTPLSPDVFVSLDPERFANSKNANTFDGLFADTGPVAGGTSWKIKIADRGGVPATAEAAIMNVTATGATSNGNVRVYPCTNEVPTVSSINFSPGTAEPNEVIAKLSDTGHVCVYASSTVHVLVDVVGYTAAGSAYTPIDPARYANSKNIKTFDSQYANTGPVAGGTFWKIKIADRGAIPASATTVVANITVTGPTANGNLRVYPCTVDIPGASALNYTPGLTRPNEVVAKLSDDGYLCIWTKAIAHVLVDAVGYIEDTPGYTPVEPTRYAHSSKTTTFDNQFAATGPVAGGTFWKIQIADRGLVPDNATTVVANVTVTNPAANGNLRVYPCTDEIPGASALNYTPGLTRPNELVAKLSDTGHLCIWTKATTDVIVDIVGHNGTI